MNRKDLMLAALYPADMDSYTPVQIQKLLFLIQKKIPFCAENGFDFSPYDYGPFDKNVYQELEILADEGYVDIHEHESSAWKTYGLTKEGAVKAKEVSDTLDDSTKSTIAKLSSFVRQLSFSQLVSAIYKAYPEMKQNSVFKD
ncbi:hypothetical protein [Legionella worsleiensis]|uniref:Antitoxin SocA-like Panacea domain-containing protein n=1 Tax=Legionella worsleiensis TaxID=45076 RepID=A0A0W1AL26_9GAMM|nr:hypothetical protein [Legionella worsleiensis]KTD81875.1 hypothetical protein Lwor_0178 [Legionella worsleiensis]STY30919.1 Uncharacterized conserved protein [Legionella worsleiensis]